MLNYNGDFGYTYAQSVYDHQIESPSHSFREPRYDPDEYYDSLRDAEIYDDCPDEEGGED